MRMTRRMTCGLGLLLLLLVTAACGTKSDSPILRVDAQFDPGTVFDTSQPIREVAPGVAQTFTVLTDGVFEEFWIVLTDGESMDDGTIRITVRPLNIAGEPDPDPNTSIIVPIEVETSTLPSIFVDEFTVFSVGGDPNRDVLVGEEYAIVVDFVSRATSNDTNAIARVLGQAGNPYADGSGATGESGVGFTNNADDYFFRTFVLEAR